jgi:hypothetical protein
MKCWFGRGGRGNCTVEHWTLVIYAVVTGLYHLSHVFRWPVKRNVEGVLRLELLLICNEEEREPRLKPNGMQIIVIPLPVLRFWFMVKGLAARLIYSFFPVLPSSSNRDKKSTSSASESLTRYLGKFCGFLTKDFIKIREKQWRISCSDRRI